MSSQPLTIINDNYQAVKNDGQDVIAGLTKSPKNLPPKYFYDDRGSEIFEEICQLPEYYPTRTEASILKEYADEIAQLTGCCELVELGSGSSTKTRLLLDAYQKIGSSFKYVPTDVSGGILKNSVLELQEKYPNFSIEGFIGTYDETLAHLKSHPTQTSFEGTSLTRTICFLGSSAGNFPPQEFDCFLNQVVNALKPGNYFLLGIDLQKPKEILEPAYNDSKEVTAAFNLNMLSHLNWRFQGNFDLDLFTHKAIYNQEKSQIEMRLYCQENVTFSLEILDLKVDFEKGESILTEVSRKFDLAAIKVELEKKGLKVKKVWTDPKQWFGLILCQA
ncbi:MULTISPECIES: L-histidine N(alpha)-methyltransferase [unclassified Okeania]|uniref:L-histidine N(alpha)-methyltransferase n=1 Tax=unclassified Okeania TaxID=2634635 RepID=UPI00142A188E|nr:MULTISPECIES: L-histidine N(alpha)-methyltransferase [unclassified Okeania]NES91203.1 L-histidine N(alpha)-methyltransferase [Okeania sp. SIO2B9]NET76601.1 L-histidine N(alpha)-methyltransferase [Okeania sp. SIO1F9]